MRRHTLTLIAALALGGAVSALAPGTVRAQQAAAAPDDAATAEAAILIADAVVVTPDNRLIADGNVEVLFDGQTLRASRVIYDQETDRVRLEGPIRVEMQDGAIITATEAEVDAGLRDGILRGARLVLDRQLQMAAVQLARVEGRYSQLSRAAVTSCQICGPNAAPLWEIRARRIIHDDQEKQIYIDGATFRVVDIPVAYIPRLRLPDPTLKRARGFLFPRGRTTTKLGTGIKIPYFIPLGDHRDLTLTPYLSPETRTLEARYRQAFRTGEIEINGAVTSDTVRKGEMRGYLFAEGRFDLPRDYTLNFDLELTSDEAYLKEYGYSGKGRLDSAIGLTKVTRDRLSSAELIYFNTLLDDEDNGTQPAIVLDARHEQRLFPRLGGELRLGAELHGHRRFSNDDVLGRDVSRANASLLWRDSRITAGGLELSFGAGLDIDAVRNDQDSTVPESDSSVAPRFDAGLRYPLVGTGAGGTRFVIEPIVQIGWTGGDRLETANDESTRSEFDEGNLLALSRFARGDRRERGAAMAAGLRWSAVNLAGWRSGLTVGRVVRQEGRAEFSTTSGLGDRTSDWLIAAELGNATGLDFIGRALIDDEVSVNRAEARGVWSNKRLNLAASYLLLPEDGQEARDDVVSEWSFDGSYRVSTHWTASAKWQYDLANDRSSSGGIGLEYQNECVIARFTADRDFADSSNLDPDTTFELTVELKGFSTGGDAGGYRRTCSN